MSDRDKVPITDSQNSQTREVVLEARNVTKRFPGVLANDNVNIKLHRGEILALLGENGAGKSTLMNIIYGLYHPDEGEILLKGQEAHFTSPREAIHSGIGMVHQHFQLIGVMNVAENVVLGEEQETPTWRSLFTILFSVLLGIALFDLVISFNAPLVYATFTFAFVATLLPMVLAWALVRSSAWFIPEVRQNLAPLQRILTLVLQAAGVLAVVLIALDAELSTGEGFVTFSGAVLVAALGYLIPAVLTYNRFVKTLEKSLLAEFLPETRQKDVWVMFLALLGIAGAGLLGVGIIWLLFQTALDKTAALTEVVEFLGLLNIIVAASTFIAFILGWLLCLMFYYWEPVVAGLRLIWGIVWRVGLIGAALWIGGLTEEISKMAIVAGMLQSEVPYTIRTANAGARGTTELTVNWRNVERNRGFEAQVNALLQQIDASFYREETFESIANGYRGQATVKGYQGIDPAWREAVDDVPLDVRDIVIGILLIAFSALSLRHWRGHRMLPGALTYDVYVLAVLGVIYTLAIWLTSKDLSLPVRLVLLIVGIVAMGYVGLRTLAERRADPERIRPISPLDNVIDALADLGFTLFSVRNRSAAAEHVRELSRQYGLEVDPNAIVEKLPVGLQQRVEIIKALYRRADILILDEPTSVLTPQESKELFRIMRELAAQGVSIIFITHKLKEVFEVATNIVVMRGGMVVGTTTPAEATEASLAAMMVGREVLLRVEKSEARPAGKVLHVENLKAYDDRGALALNGVSFEVEAGEVLGIAGVQGNGQSELVEVLTGLRNMDAGAVELLGQELKPQRHPNATPAQRFWAFILDVALIGLLTIPVSYFWSYFGKRLNTFEILSLQSLLIFIALDAIYTIGAWRLWGATFGKAVLSLQIADRDRDTRPSVGAIVERYMFQRGTIAVFVLAYTGGWLILQELLKTVFDTKASPQVVGAVTVAAILLVYGRLVTGPGQGVWHLIDMFLHQPWYDRVPGVRCHVVHRVAITSRKIKDLRTSHIPEDRHRFGMVKSFMIAENLILNDYYETPHARQPTTVQLPFLVTVYSVLFGAIFAVTGYVWLYFWNHSLWNRLLDLYGTPQSGVVRSIPLTQGMSEFQRNYIDDPLIVSLLILLSLTLFFSVLAYLLTGVILRYFANPYSFVPPLLVTLGGVIAFSIMNPVVDSILPGLHDFITLRIIAIVTPFLDSVATGYKKETNQFVLALLGLLFLLLAGGVNDWLRRGIEKQREFAAIKERLRTTPLGHFVEVEQDTGLLLNLYESLDYCSELIREFDIRTPSALNTGSSLSGGNQQKMVVAREFSRKPRLLIASQPTRGIDVGSIEFIHKQIIEQRDKGAAVLLVSAELDEIMSLSDRIAVMYKGEIIKVIEAKAATREELGLLMAGIVR